MAEKHSVISTTRMASFANKEQPSPLYWQREVSCVPFSIHHPSNKSAKNLDMCGICVNTHTHTHTHTILARQYIIKHLIYNGLPESIIRGYPCLTTKVPINTHPLPYCLKKGRIFLWSDGTGERSLRPNIVGFLFPPITV